MPKSRSSELRTDNCRVGWSIRSAAPGGPDRPRQPSRYPVSCVRCDVLTASRHTANPAGAPNNAAGGINGLIEVMVPDTT